MGDKREGREKKQGRGGRGGKGKREVGLEFLHLFILL